MEYLDLFEKVCAAAIGMVCIVLLARQFMGAPRRARLDRAVLGATRATRRMMMRLYRWPAVRRAARLEAEAAIRRARGVGEWDGNVFRTKPTKPPRKPRKFH